MLHIYACILLQIHTTKESDKMKKCERKGILFKEKYLF